LVMAEPTREEIGDLLRRLVDTVVEMKDRADAAEQALATARAFIQHVADGDSKDYTDNYQQAEAILASLAHPAPAPTPSPEAVAKAALEWAVRKIEDESNHQNDLWIDACEHVAFEIGFAANDPDTIAAIIKTAEERKDE
jgi:hypothetical protein